MRSFCSEDKKTSEQSGVCPDVSCVGEKDAIVCCSFPQSNALLNPLFDYCIVSSI